MTPPGHTPESRLSTLKPVYTQTVTGRAAHPPADPTLGSAGFEGRRGSGLCDQHSEIFPPRESSS